MAATGTTIKNLLRDARSRAESSVERAERRLADAQAQYQPALAAVRDAIESLEAAQSLLTATTKRRDALAAELRDLRGSYVLDGTPAPDPKHESALALDLARLDAAVALATVREEDARQRRGYAQMVAGSLAPAVNDAQVRLLAAQQAAQRMDDEI
jgi:hypothetical protein